ncbi:helix-turn-helix transcriptional regulator [Agriterribacter sp.]|uniref:helix-turn-helix domain-containing protein n=1 Tax=Agriterribacter sp. TaxID=2821509 RepID=UPI002CFC3EEE|nr:helix-turn-helix transcriptional regulator [Agriterribacter sp.]HRP58345.1 helix-turn-helix transcriptional regulator [Agriterribacter sp.]
MNLSKMESIEKVLEKLKTARKEKGFSHENMAAELEISQAAYTNIEKNESKLSVERLLKISEILEKPVYYFFESNPNNIYNQSNNDNAIGHIDHLYQDNREARARLAESYESSIKNLKEEIVFLRDLVNSKGK